MTKKNIKIIDDAVMTNNDNVNNLSNITNCPNIDHINNKNNVNFKTNKQKSNSNTKTKKNLNKKNIKVIEENIQNAENTTDNLKEFDTIDKINNIVDEQNINNSSNNEKALELCTPKKSNDFFKELLQKQLTNVNITKKLTYNDIRRISKFLVSSIFDENNCSIWNGYITNEKNQTKGTYINFYFNQKKIALHRLLYLNFIGDILNTEYIKFSCVNKGKCCNIHHMKKYSYNSTLTPPNAEDHHVDNSVHIVQNKNDLVIEL
jgi:hypothetical protein